MEQSQAKDDVLIIGAGVFGLSMAYELSLRGHHNITVLDRALPPVPDGSSVDISRIIRYDYNDRFYSKLAREAVETWKSSDLFKPFYHGTGLVLTSELESDPYLEKNKAVLTSQSQPFSTFSNISELKRLKPALQDIETPFSGYINPNAGWADAAGAINALAKRCSEKGVSFMTGSRGTITGIKVNDKSQVVGVNVLSGSFLPASRVILATGAWTSRYLNLDHAIIGSAQPIGFIQLTQDEAQKLMDIPVVINKTNGVFIFPPTPDTHVLKVAYHGHGYETETSNDGERQRIISAPKRDSNNAQSRFLPEDASEYLRYGLRQLVPSIAEKPWSKTRMCWYTETPTGDFIGDFHDSISGLFIATGGSGQYV